MPTTRALLSSLVFLVSLASCTSTPRGPATLGHLMVQRLSWMDDVAQIKAARSLPITDPVREAALLVSMEKLGIEAGLPARPVRAFFTGQMTAAREYQAEYLRQHPKPAASSNAKPLPDLNTTVRPALDQIGRQMITALAKTRGTPLTSAEEITTQARQQLTEAGYSNRVVTPALQGLEAALK